MKATMNPPNISPNAPNFNNVRDLKPGMKNLNLNVMILEQVKDAHKTKEGLEVRTFKVADRTGCVNLCVFGENGRLLRPGDIIHVLNGYCSLFQGFLVSYIGKVGRVKRVGEFCHLISEEPNMSEVDFNAKMNPPPNASAPNNFVPPHSNHQTFPFPSRNFPEQLPQTSTAQQNVHHNFPPSKMATGGGGYFSRSLTVSERPEMPRNRVDSAPKVSTGDLYRDL